MRIYPKSYGNEVYFDSMDELQEYLKVDFIKEKVLSANENYLPAKEYFTMETANGFILGVYRFNDGVGAKCLYSANNSEKIG